MRPFDSDGVRSERESCSHCAPNSKLVSKERQIDKNKLAKKEKEEKHLRHKNRTFTVDILPVMVRVHELLIGESKVESVADSSIKHFSHL